MNKSEIRDMFTKAVDELEERVGKIKEILEENCADLQDAEAVIENALQKINELADGLY